MPPVLPAEDVSSVVERIALLADLVAERKPVGGTIEDVALEAEPVGICESEITELSGLRKSQAG